MRHEALMAQSVMIGIGGSFGSGNKVNKIIDKLMG